MISGENLKFASFCEMLDYRRNKCRNKVIFQYLDKRNNLISVSILDFCRDIDNCKKNLNDKNTDTLLLVGPTSYELIVRFFGAVIANKRTAVIDDMSSEETIAAVVKVGRFDDINFLTDAYDEKEKIQALIEANKNSKIPCHNENNEGDILFFTSGTTDLSKAVVLDSQIVLSSAYNGQSKLPCSTDDTLYSILPLSHVMGFVCSLLWPLCYGSTVALGSSVRNLIQDLSIFQPTVISLVPLLAMMLIKYNLFPKSLKTILIGAGPIDLKSISAIRERGIHVAFGYGLTETASGVAISTDSNNPYAMELCPDTKIEISGEGEVLCATSCMMKGYFGNPEATNKVLENGYLHTHDRGFLDSKNKLHITGRIDDVEVLGNGKKIDSQAYENELLAYLPNSDYCIAGQKGVLTCFIYDKSKTTTFEEDILKKISHFNSGKEADRQIKDVIFRESPLPRTKLGKVQKYILRGE